MKKRLICLLVLVCLMGSMLCACETKEEITAQQAISIMLEDLGDDAKNMSNPHVHTGTYENKSCYNIYVTINGESWAYIISTEGEILSKGPGGHSH